MSNKSLAHATAIAVIYLVVALFVVTSIQAQPPCSTGATTVTIKKLIQYNGVCCEVQFVVCYL